MLSLPFNSSTAVMYYNKDAFRKAGLDPEKPPVTWPEFFEAAKKLKASGMEGGFSTNWISWIQLENFSAWHNQPFGTKNNGFDGLDTELVVQYARSRSSTSRRSTTCPRTRSSSTADARTRPTPCSPPAQVGMHFESIGGYGNFKNTCKFDFGVARLPYYPDVAGAPQNSIIGGASLWVFNGKTKDEYKGVAQFFTFLSLPEIQAFWHQNTGYLPITMAAYELTKSQGFYKNNPGPEIAIKQLLNKAPDGQLHGHPLRQLQHHPRDRGPDLGRHPGRQDLREGRTGQDGQGRQREAPRSSSGSTSKRHSEAGSSRASPGPPFGGPGIPTRQEAIWRSNTNSGSRVCPISWSCPRW